MDGEKGLDVESGKPTRIPYLTQVFDRGSTITPEIRNYDYAGKGTDEEPFVVTWIPDDPRNPLNYSPWRRWTYTMIMAFATLAVAFVSSAFSGGAREIIVEFNCSREVYVLGISLVVLGFSAGPLVWSGMSELAGRQVLFIVTYGGLTAFNAGAAGSQNIWTLLIMRFFAGFFGSSPLTNAGGVIFDMFPARERGLATAIFAAMPLLGPVIGPICGGFIGETIGWRWIEGVMAIFTGVLWILGALVPETFAPVLLRRRAASLSKITGNVYKSKVDIDQGPITFSEACQKALLRPLVLLFSEPIVLLLSLYMSIIYGTLYMLFGAFPIVYQEVRGWSPGIGGLAFIGVAIGILAGLAYAIYDNRRYIRVADAHGGFAPPEARLPMAMLGAVLLPIGLIWFAWTNAPSVHYLVSIAGTIFFGCSILLVFVSVFCYLIDAYTVFAASVLAANSVLRSLFGAAFPLFTAQMYAGAGIHWASMIPAFLALACLPFPFLFYKYGKQIRAKCKYSALADKIMKSMLVQMKQSNIPQDAASEKAASRSSLEQDDAADKGEKETVQEAFEEHSAASYSLHDNTEGFQPIKTVTSRTGNLSRVSTRRSSFGKDRPVAYEGNPFDLDRVNTRESFPHEAKSRSRANSATSGTRK